jgi:hypothetical protein
MNELVVRQAFLSFALPVPSTSGPNNAATPIDRLTTNNHKTGDESDADVPHQVLAARNRRDWPDDATGFCA